MLPARHDDDDNTFPNGISAMCNANSVVQDLNSSRCIHFLRRYPLHYDHLLSRSETVKERKGEFISDVLLWIPTYGYISIGQAEKIYIQQLCADTGCSLKNLAREMTDRDG